VPKSPSPGAAHPSPGAAQASEVVCPHCKKPFEAELIDGPAERYRGFKCPHCRLFVPSERAEDPQLSGS
jgi:DNA-directed RNA polymerase subunit RPC12/RpoP